MIIVLFFGLFLFTANDSDAMCIYNEVGGICSFKEANCSIGARFDCGIFCSNNFNFISPGDRKCRPSKAGTVFACLIADGDISDKDPVVFCDALQVAIDSSGDAPSACKHKVKAHGWVDVLGRFKPGTQFKEISCTVHE